MDSADNATSSPFGVQSVTRLLTCAASDNATLVSAKPCRLYSLNGYTSAATVRFIKLYDKATAPLSTDTPKITLALRPSLDFSPAMPDVGVSFTQGLGFRITTLVADSDATSPTAGDVQALALMWQ